MKPALHQLTVDVASAPRLPDKGRFCEFQEIPRHLNLGTLI